jgi:DNA repair protein RadC
MPNLRTTSPAQVIVHIRAQQLSDHMLQNIVLRGAPGLFDSHMLGCREKTPLYLTAPQRRDERLAQLLECANELLRRQTITNAIGTSICHQPSTIGELLKTHFRTLDVEVFSAVYLDTNHRILGIEELFRGTLDQTPVFAREVVKHVLAHNAASVILAHNHPSGEATPSRADELITQKLKGALSLIDVKVLDHVIVADDTLYSFAEHGLL